jgi:hypothetical protein
VIASVAVVRWNASRSIQPRASPFDLDLVSDRPASRRQSSRDVARAPGMNGVVRLRAPEEHRTANHQLEPLAKRGGDPVHRVDGHVHTSGLDVGQIPSMQSQGVCELLLGQIEIEPASATGRSE